MITWCWVDSVILGILVLSIITGLIRGFVKELIAFAAWVFGIWLVFNYYEPVGLSFAAYIHDKMVRNLLAVILILLGTILVGSLVNMMLRFILHSAGLSGTDRLLGMLFGFIRGVFIVSILILATQLTAFEPVQDYTHVSFLYPKFEPIVNWLGGFTPRLMEQIKAIDGKIEPSTPISAPTPTQGAPRPVSNN